ncbi:hypothetical protein SS50377_20935 [Spironucleus salmonicida]|uniref:Uncharacterized protein n=1 Tax=Spironucleus salmonicida TaxID=348837 RepID=V6LH23_9EUKA|nr:hypothetical protein SS50377_20935 [Spironucleus salmonicida]|eukprot:EST43608.1 Hypothetical protein SS50377_16650 [Spironucleus salmonicida]
MDPEIETSDSIIEEIEIEFNQPPNQQLLHLYQFPIRPNFREYAAPQQITYYPEHNKLNFQTPLDIHDNFDPDHEYNELTNMQFTGSAVHHFAKKQNFAIGTFLNSRLIIQPISEIYTIQPDFTYINSKFQAEIDPYEKLDNNVLTLPNYLQTVPYTYSYIQHDATEKERFQFSTPSSPLPFDVPPDRYKNLFTTTQNSLQKLSNQLQTRPDLRSKCELLVRDQRIISLEQAKRLVKETGLLHENLINFAQNVLGIYVIQSRFAVPEMLQRARDFVLFYIAIGGIEVEGIDQAGVENRIQFIIDEKQNVKIDRKYIKKMTNLSTQNMSRIFELDGLIQPQGDDWVFGFTPDYVYLQENMSQIAKTLAEAAGVVLKDVEGGREILETKNEGYSAKVMKIIREE